MTHSIGKQTLSGLCIAFSLLLYPSAPAQAEVRFSLGVHIGFQVPFYPRMTLIPGYPVYYSPRLDLNYFFYDGLYWVFHDDDWYSSGWYNGPWDRISPAYVPTFLLRIPVRYYRQPPVYFRNWRVEAAPRWDERWGRDWERNRPDWNRWDRRITPRPAPLPSYQQKYSGPRYPSMSEQQQRIRSDNYRYQPREEASRQQWRPSARPEPETRRNDPTPPLRREQNEPLQSRPAQNTQQQNRDRDRNLAPAVPQQSVPVQRQEQEERRQDSRNTPQQRLDTTQPQVAPIESRAVTPTRQTTPRQNASEQRREQVERRQDSRNTPQQRPDTTQQQVAPIESRAVTPTRQTTPRQNASEQRREQVERRQDSKSVSQPRSDETGQQTRRKLPVTEQSEKYRGTKNQDLESSQR